MKRPEGDGNDSPVEDESEQADRRASRTEESTSSEEAMAQSDDVDDSVADESAYSGENE